MSQDKNQTITTLPDSWEAFLKNEFESDYFKKLKSFLTQEITQGHIIYPHPTNILRAFDLCSPKNLKVVIIGQDPYHGPGQAHGLSFSVPKDVKIPPSLQNIYKEIESDLGYRAPNNGNLESWAKQGVLLLNATLTVRKSAPTSHARKGWETFTDHAIEYINDNMSQVVFLLWGRYAQEKGSMINKNRHCILKAAHPSPFSAHSGFFGCKHFSQTNNYLKQNGISPIDWQIK